MRASTTPATLRPSAIVNTIPPLDPSGISSLAAHSLLLEIRTWPKPGLVSHVDTGSHDDMDAETFCASALAIEPYFYDLAVAGSIGCEMGRLRIIGIEAETAMLAATGGINTHRGAIFGMGLLCAAAGVRASGDLSDDLTLGDIVSGLWGLDILDGPIPLHSNGNQMRRRFGAGGARLEAAQGFPTVYDVGLPALRHALSEFPDNPEAARVQTCFSLIARLEDTNLLHRGGKEGLTFAQHAAQRFLSAGGIKNPQWKQWAHSIHREFVDRRLSPGGSADLLAMTLFVNAQEPRGA